MLKKIELSGFKSFAKKTTLTFESRIAGIVGPNGSGKSNIVEAVRFVLGEQSMKSLRGKSGSDLIFQGSKFLSKQNRASASIIFDNSKKVFKLPEGSRPEINIDFDEIIISREVFQDGVGRYTLNGTDVRLKDIIEIVSSVNIGSSGHHIISQGEADRLLNASPQDRREMIEDALGLKVYQYRLRESERKIEKTEENIKEISVQRREILPHLNFLKKQVEKVEKAASMKTELGDLYQEYLKLEETFINSEKENIKVKRGELEVALSSIEVEIKQNGGESSFDAGEDKKLQEAEKSLRETTALKDELLRKLGRIEGMVEFLSLEKNEEDNSATERISILQKEFSVWSEDVMSSIDAILSNDDISQIRISVGKLKDVFSSFVKKYASTQVEKREDKRAEKLADLIKQKDAIFKEVSLIESKEAGAKDLVINLRKEADVLKEKYQEAKLRSYELTMKKNSIVSELHIWNLKQDTLNHREEDFMNEIREGSVLVGESILFYKNFTVNESFNIDAQEERRKKIEKLKIRLEDMGAGGEDFLKEYKDLSDRDQFLERELADLTMTIQALHNLSEELKEKLAQEFENGIDKINVEFEVFFKLMFGGGNASLEILKEEKKSKRDEDDEDEEVSLEEEEKEFEPGILINVSLPHKKVKALHALSGGERSLVSIALLFAMSQVNPPPFLVLDETDAALDEANSRKYGDMIEKLSKFSQLILVTHNRETMSRAGTLYGVTIGSDGGSKILSIRFEEAVVIAK